LRRLAVAALAVLAGCGGSEAPITGGGRVVGDALTVYSSLPNPGRGEARDMVDAQKLAVQEVDGQAGGHDLNFVSVDEAASPAAAAERVIRDPQVIAVIGALRSRTAMTSVPLFNAAGILLVSPGAGFSGFATSDRWFPAGRGSFFSLVRDDRAQARALLDAAGARRVAVEPGDGRASAALVAALEAADAADGGVRIVDRARTVIYTDDRTAPDPPPGVRPVLPDALTRAGVRLPRAVYVTSAPEPGSTPELRAFEAAFRERFGREPGRYAVLGYEAMRSVIRALDRAAPRANLRHRVIQAYEPPAPRGFTSFR
jgi:ABC-type branched-subunit amino acid transport system substrate-binding protein